MFPSCAMILVFTIAAAAMAYAASMPFAAAGLLVMGVWAILVAMHFCRSRN